MSERDEDELEQLREERLEELQDKAQDEEEMQARQQQAEAQKKAILRQHLTDDARKRLNTIKMSKPDFAERVEQQLIALAQSGRIQGKIDDEKMKQLLKELKPDSKSFNIRHR